MPSGKADSQAREEARTKRDRDMELDETCAACGAPIGYFNDLDFDARDLVTQGFHCRRGHHFYAIFTLLDVLRNPDARRRP